MPRRIQILIVEDSSTDTELIVGELCASGFEPEWTRVDSEADYLRHLRPELDLIISDFTLPLFSGMRALELRNQLGYEIPFIVISGTIGEEIAVEAIKHGATDYLLKDRLARLAPAVQQALEQARLRQEHRKAEMALLEGEYKFQTLFDSANDPIYMIHDGVFVDCNAKGSNIYGRTRDEIIGHRPDEFCPPTQPCGRNSREKAQEIMNKALAGEPQFFEWISSHPDGTLVYSEVSLNRVDLSGKVYLQAIARDITDRKEAQQAMSESETRFRTLVDESPVAIGISRNGIGIYANRRFQSIYGLKSTEEFIGRHVSDFFAPEVQPESRERVRRRVQGLPVSNDFESIGLRTDGQMFPVQVMVAQVALADGVAEIGFLTDITDRKRAEAQIAEQAAFLDKARDAIIVRDLEGKIVFWNKGAERVYGWTRAEVMGRHVLEVLHTNTIKFKELNSLAISQGDWTGELQHVTKDQREITCEVRCTLIRDDAGQPKLVLSINSDVTDKKKIEAQSMRAQRMESIGTLAGGIAHDLNNILAPIMMSIAVLKTTAKDQQTEKILDIIEVSAQRGADIVRQVLTFARGLEGERTEVQPKQLLKDLENIIKETFPKDIRSNFSIPRDCWAILGDPTQLHQILLNLCVNARDAMPHGGDLSVEVKNCTFEDEQLAKTFMASTGRYVNINVTDSGMGIPPNLLNKVFEPFFTTKDMDKGTGLGLSTVMAIVKSHHGFVNVNSSPGRGTTFQLYLPASEDTAAESKTQLPQTSMPRGNGEIILVVDDEVPILTMTRGTLQAFGYRVLTAMDGEQALALYGEHRASIAIVLTDLIMPRMDGAALIRSLKKIDPAVKIIVTSGLCETESTNIEGVKAFLPKPITTETLLKSVYALIKET